MLLQNSLTYKSAFRILNPCKNKFLSIINQLAAKKRGAEVTPPDLQNAKFKDLTPKEIGALSYFHQSLFYLLVLTAGLRVHIKHSEQL
jgi:hypothetical protein